MQVTRRGFLGGALATGAGIGLLGRRAHACGGRKPKLRVRYAKESTTICPYCGVGCGAIVSASGGKVVNIEGAPDHPINRGSLCSKGGTLYQVVDSERRLKKVLYRAPGGDHWQEKTWNWAIGRISRRIKETRDAQWVDKDAEGNTVNRTEAMASVGSVFLNSEEAYAYCVADVVEFVVDKMGLFNKRRL